MKPIRISGHARFEMRRRGIRPSAVVSVIRAPGQVLPARKGRQIYQSLIGKAARMLLRVVVKEDETAYHVVTAYKTSKVAKYRRTP
jgi:hypothetical protein